MMAIAMMRAWTPAACSLTHALGLGRLVRWLADRRSDAPALPE